MGMYTPENRHCKAACKNFLGFVVSRPPCVIFVIFIGAFALGLLSLGYYVQSNNLLDAEATKGWTHIYSNFSSLTFCVPNTTLSSNSTAKSSTNTPNEYMSSEMVNISLPFNVLVKQVAFDSMLNTTELTGTIPYFFLDLAVM